MGGMELSRAHSTVGVDLCACASHIPEDHRDRLSHMEVLPAFAF